MSDGRHLILDMYGCSKVVLDDRQLLVQALESALRMAKANVLRIISNKFEPQGVTVLALLAESHASNHTWPEIGYCAIDLYTCGEETDTHAAAQYLKNRLAAENVEEKELVRSITPSNCV